MIGGYQLGQLQPNPWIKAGLLKQLLRPVVEVIARIQQNEIQIAERIQCHAGTVRLPVTWNCKYHILFAPKYSVSNIMVKRSQPGTNLIFRHFRRITGYGRIRFGHWQTRLKSQEALSAPVCTVSSARDWQIKRGTLEHHRSRTGGGVRSAFGLYSALLFFRVNLFCVEQIIYGVHFRPIIIGNVCVVQLKITFKDQLYQCVFIPLVIESILDHRF